MVKNYKLNAVAVLCRKLGYSVSADGTVEQQNEFLRRVSGYTRLYAALIITSPPPAPGSGPSSVHPHGIEHAWSWLSHIVNVEPRPDVTATVLLEFLSVAGHSLWRTYHRQFVKLVQSMFTDYLPRVAAVSLAGAGGPVTRLESLLKSCINGTIPAPKGLLSQSFWNT